LDAIALQLNMRPRKRFDFKCPIEVMGEVMQEAMAMRHDAPACCGQQNLDTGLGLSGH
jgi:hypothetical protein